MSENQEALTRNISLYSLSIGTRPPIATFVVILEPVREAPYAIQIQLNRSHEKPLFGIQTFDLDQNRCFSYRLV